MSTASSPPEIISELRKFLNEINVEKLNLDKNAYDLFTNLIKKDEGHLLKSDPGLTEPFISNPTLLYHLRLADNNFYYVCSDCGIYENGLDGSVSVLITMMDNELRIFQLEEKDPKYVYTKQIKEQWEKFIEKLEEHVKIPPPIINELHKFLNEIEVENLNLEAPANRVPESFKKTVKGDDGFKSLLSYTKNFYDRSSEDNISIWITMMQNELRMFKLDETDPKYGYTKQIKEQWENFIAKLKQLNTLFTQEKEKEESESTELTKQYKEMMNPINEARHAKYAQSNEEYYTEKRKERLDAIKKMLIEKITQINNIETQKISNSNKTSLITKFWNSSNKTSLITEWCKTTLEIINSNDFYLDTNRVIRTQLEIMPTEVYKLLGVKDEEPIKSLIKGYTTTKLGGRKRKSGKKSRKNRRKSRRQRRR